MAMMTDGDALTARQAFGSVGTAMVTPMDESGEIDWAAVRALAARLVDGGNDFLAVSGTTGESPTTSDDEKRRLLDAVLDEVGDRARVIAGIGTNDTRHTLALAAAAREAGANGLLLVSPYYSKPPQNAIAAHMRAVADAAELPIMLYDIPGRSGVALAEDTLRDLAGHPNILAVKDAKGDLECSARLMAETDLAYYSGDDSLNLPLLAVGAVGVVSTIGNVAPERVAALVAAVQDNDLDTARRLNAELLPLIDTIMNHLPGAVSAKAALELMGVIPHRADRLPLLPADGEQLAFLRKRLTESGILS
ncbi:4-hydroxy-tetrahydrodipicolinate synthase [Brevibacterium sp. 5221]|uniref:4-hydroxy-tetrahydrodipicolinate synthase n=1 Tax=Brevibacterium rongguiense TaxID=2695267 RepID=A0A6N9H7H6_9MICO|nr:4-hydroxy-tetrahydrodipicolinate synthase [Brevibacterium rongguiense]MYM20028.1 4-hydroxy-tetrahydrodipicolinate synthase [Brevibacterium rongguiense]